MHIGTCVNLVPFLSHYFRLLKILVPHSLLILTVSRVLIGVGNRGVGNGVSYRSPKLISELIMMPIGQFT